MNLINYLRDTIILVIFALVGALGIAAACYFCYDTISFIRNAENTKGVILDFKHNTGTSRSPIIHFRLANGTEGEFISDFESSAKIFEKGEEVQILYLPASPIQTARLDSFSELWLLPFVFGTLGLVFGGIPIGMWIYDRRSTLDLEKMTLRARMDKTQSSKQTNSLNKIELPPIDSPYKFIFVFPAIGVFLLLLGGYFAWKHYQFTQTAPQYRAKVVANEWRSKSYYPVFEFQDKHGDTIDAYSDIGTNPPLFAIGESSEIFFDPHDNSATARGFFVEWFIVLILGFIGTLFTGIGIILMVVFRKE